VILAALLAACASRPSTPLPVEAAAAQAAATAPSELTPKVRLVLEAAAADLDVDVRRRALGVLVRVRPETWAERALHDPSTYVRRAGIAALAARGGADVLLRRTAAEDADCWTRGDAAWHLSAADALGLEAAGCAAVWAAQARHGHASATDALSGWLRASDLPIELTFLRRLGALAPVAPALRDALATAEPEVRLAGAAALLAHEPGHARTVLEPALRSSDEDVALEALELLLATDGDQVAPLLRVVRTAGPRTARDVAALALVGKGEGALAEAIARVDDPEREVRVAAYRAVAERLRREPEARGADRARASARQASDSADPVVQAAAIAVLRGSPHEEDRAALLALLDAESLLTQVLAAEALSAP
jgi:HEAT repeat protein